MTKQSHLPDNKRRRFLKGSLAAGGVAAASTVAGTSLAGMAGNDTAAAAEDNKEEGYRLTKHIADYYKSAAA